MVCLVLGFERVLMGCGFRFKVNKVDMGYGIWDMRYKIMFLYG
jgi:hypothetical protein